MSTIDMNLNNKIIDNLFIVHSPLQLISAIEASNYFKNEINTLLICYLNEKKNNQQLTLIMECYKKWSDVIIVPASKTTFQRSLRLILIIKKLKAINFSTKRIFIGEYRSWQMMQFLYTLKPKDCFLLDDGNITIDLQKNYLPTSKLYWSSSFSNRLKELFLHLILKSNNKEKKLINLFTCFELTKFSSQQQVIRHNFEFFRSTSSKKNIDKSKIFFFGSPLSELNLLSLKQEIEFVGFVKKYYEKVGKIIIYIPHRRDSDHKIKHLSKELDIKYIYFDSAAEVEIVNRSNLPCGIASFYSSTLLTLPKIASFEFVDSFKFPISDLPEKYRDEIELVYKNYKEFMRVIDIF